MEQFGSSRMIARIVARMIAFEVSVHLWAASSITEETPKAIRLRDY
jgi:hypothetical protein